MKSKRLFLIAGYNTQARVDASLIYMLKQFKPFGDIILVIDSNIPTSELNKISQYVLYSSATRHGEYDFGSYKRGYEYAKKNNLLSQYDYVYLVNDSVYGPILPMGPIFEKIENFKTEAFGLVCNPHKDHPHIQSWFIGMRQSVFLSEWFDTFITSVTLQKSKGAITRLYEQGFSKKLDERGIVWRCIYSVSGRGIYNKIKKLYKQGMPFIKKSAFTRHNGALGMQINYILNRISPAAHDAIISGAKDTLGKQYIQWLLTDNPIKIIYRNIKYFVRKINIEGL